MKLTPAEIRYLKAIPEDFDLGDGSVIKIGLTMSRAPKYTSIVTLRNLFKKGLIKHASIEFYCCPFCLTEKGKEIINHAPNNH